ncbi:hypothetical protein LTR86_010680 [Recurvomyces mirabilis]|nr:hypothetical protein LTR86_010680 [Recurvomyces mirabilis]
MSSGQKVTNASFPPNAWLGCGLDLTGITPNDLDLVAKHVLSIVRIVSLKNGSSTQTVGSATWTVPDNVSISLDVNVGQTASDSFTSGKDAAQRIQKDADFSAKYLALSADASMNYAIDKTFSENRQATMFTYNQTMLIANLTDFLGNIQEDFLAARVNALPKWDQGNDDVVRKYRSLFRKFGSHVITGCSYGGRLQVNVQMDNSDSTLNEQFAADISASYGGLTSGGKFDASVQSTTHYAEFNRRKQANVVCSGGDPKLRDTIRSTATQGGVFGTFQQWLPTIDANPDVMSFNTMNLWDLVSLSAQSSDRAGDVESAFDYCVLNPEPHQTKCRFTVDSDWGEFAMLTPSAMIMNDPNAQPVFTDKLGRSKITLGAEHSRNFQRDNSVDFLIVNDGSPVDFVLSHGADGSSGGNGKCTVSVSNNTFTNDQLHGGNWNSQTFYAADVA